jgi:hypothetical protein
MPHPPDANEVSGELRPTSPRSDLPAVDRTERLPADDQPARWSKADLRQRLERLPPGHPSSLRSDQPDAPHHARDGGSEMYTASESLERGADSTRTRRLENPGRPADTATRNYWSEEAGFLRAWADHVSRWPAEPAAAVVDRSRDPAGSWRGDGNQYLDPEQHVQANDVIAGVRQTEKKLTEHMTETGGDNARGAWLEGLEFRLKDEERLKEKIADLSETGAPYATTAEIARQIPDAIRYTFCADPENYKDTYQDIKGRLETSGYGMYYSENHWLDAQYKGINTRWVAPEGQRFEVQFHTPESFRAKQAVTHVSYERLRNASTTDSERRELMIFQQEVCSWIRTPEGAADIPNYREEGH